MKLLSLKNIISKTAVIRFFITAFTIFLLIFIYKQFNKNLLLSNDIWTGTAITIGTTYYQYQYQKNKERIERSARAKDIVIDEFNVRLTAVSSSIRRFETRVDSVLLSLKKLENSMSELTEDLESIENKINTNEVQLLRDRFELYRVFFNEILTIKTDLARLEGSEKVVFDIDKMLESIRVKINKNVETE